MSAPSSIPRIIDSDSDSDDDVPLSALRAKAPAVKEERKTEVKSEVKAELPTVNGLSASANGNGKRQAAPDSDSDDDIPISGLARRKKMKVETKLKAEKAEKPTPSSRSTPRNTPRKTKKRVIKIKIRQQECSEALYETLKGRLAQELLCRWWYAMEWPPAKKSAPKLHGVQELDGFPGAFIRVKGDDLGSIIDTRSSVGKPSFLHFFAMPSADLLKLLLQAYDKQMEVLVEHEGPDTSLLKDLQKERASASRIDPDKADRSVRKVLKEFAELEREIKEVQALALKEEENNDEDGDEDDDDEDDDDDDD
ncbi:Intraflagellar Transport Protein 20 [Phytophthora cinnamomi]|uniref:Intraflagellar Transport Protein 20 n=1 Tax=Phytophthora cinnamomi TaxID=4785 RepID=UPI003559E975|nr:Intraflagellar Transport Protein 20 [Phytophthora cinnamomi]